MYAMLPKKFPKGKSQWYIIRQKFAYMNYVYAFYSVFFARRKRESKNAKQMRNTKQNCFSHSSATPRNNKQCSAKQ